MRVHRLMVVVLSVALIVPLYTTFSVVAADTGTLTEIARLGRGWIGSLSWTADGNAVLAASMSGVWRYGLDGNDERLLPPSGTQVGPHYVTDNAHGKLSITALATGEHLPFQLEVAATTRVAFSPDQTHLAIADGATIEVWLLPEGERKTSIRIDAIPSGETLTFSADNRLVAAVFTVRRENAQRGEPSNREEIRVWDTVTGEPVTTLTTDGLDFLDTSVAFSADNKIVITSRVGGITVYDIASGAYRRFNLAALPSDSDSKELRVVHGAVYSHAESRIVGSWFDAAPDKQMAAYVTVWDAETGQIINQLDGLRGYVRGLATSPEDARIAVYSYEGTVLVWDLVGAPQILTDQHPAGADVLAVHGETLAVGGFDHALRLWSLPERKLHTTIFGHNSEVQAVAFSLDGLLASASRYDTWTWSAQEGVQAVDVPVADTLTLGFSGDVLHGVSGLPGDISSLWTAYEQNVERTGLGVSGDVAAIAGQRVAIHTPENIVLFDLAGRELARFLPRTIVSDLSFSPDAALLLISSDRDLSLWIVEADPVLLWRIGTDGRVSASSFSPDGDLIALGTDRGALELRSVRDGALVSVTTFQGTLSDVIFSPDGQSMIAAIDTQIVIWSMD